MFTLQGYGPISAADVPNYAHQSRLLWGYDGLEDWVAAQAQPSQPPAPGASMMGAAVGGAVTVPPPRKKGGLPAWAIVLIALAAVVALAVMVPLVMYGDQKGAAKESAVKEGIHSIQIGVQSYAVDNDDAYPDQSLVNETGMMLYVDIWPQNPFTGLPMSQGTSPGDYSYTRGSDGASFALVGYGKSGVVITVP